MSGRNLNQDFNWTQPGLVAMPETDGHGDTCGPIVIADYLHLLGRFDLTIPNIDNLRQQLINWGLMDSGKEVGMALSQIVSAFENHFSIKPEKFVDYTDTLDFNQFHLDIINALTHKKLVIYETNQAFALPDGQRNVYRHFVLLGGIDSLKGYYTCNGDTYTALKSKTPVSPVWYGIGSIANSKPCGYIILPAIPVPAAPPAPPEPAVTPSTPPPTPVPQPTAFTVEMTNLLDSIAKSCIDVSNWLKLHPGEIK